MQPIPSVQVTAGGTGLPKGLGGGDRLEFLGPLLLSSVAPQSDRAQNQP